MSDFDALRFDIELAIKLDRYVPRSKRDRSQWAEHVSEKIAERLRQHWEFKHKPGLAIGPRCSDGVSDVAPAMRPFQAPRCYTKTAGLPPIATGRPA